MRNGRDRNSYRSLADTHGLALFGQSNFSVEYAAAISGLRDSSEEALPTREREGGVGGRKGEVEGRGGSVRWGKNQPRVSRRRICSFLARRSGALSICYAYLG